MEKFQKGRVIFAGDSAHQVSPFGARGANSGIQDADNLGWKLDLVIRGIASPDLLQSYNEERVQAADENILNSTRSTDFLTPKTEISYVFRNAVLSLAQDHAFARPLVNSGRLSVPCVYDGSSLNGEDGFASSHDSPARTRPGSPCPDAPIGDQFLLDQLSGEFMLLAIGEEAVAHCPKSLIEAGIAVHCQVIAKPGQELKNRYLGNAGSAIYLIRPDQHVAARWLHYDEQAVRSAVRRIIGKA
jgi:3-(3-hydroxy-phenyl)propionate hydroxylase